MCVGVCVCVGEVRRRGGERGIRRSSPSLRPTDARSKLHSADVKERLDERLPRSHSARIDYRVQGGGRGEKRRGRQRSERGREGKEELKDVSIELSQWTAFAQPRTWPLHPARHTAAAARNFTPVPSRERGEEERAAAAVVAAERCPREGAAVGEEERGRGHPRARPALRNALLHSSAQALWPAGGAAIPPAAAAARAGGRRRRGEKKRRRRREREARRRAAGGALQLASSR